MPSSLNGTGVTFNDATTLNSNSVNVQTFTSTGTWTKPTDGKTMAFIQVWGGGGGSGRHGIASATGGGGGGGYNEITVPLSYLASSVTASIGAGGSAATVVNTNAGSGGDSTFALATAWNGATTVGATGGIGATYNVCSGGFDGGSGGKPRTQTTITALYGYEWLGGNGVSYGSSLGVYNSSYYGGGGGGRPSVVPAGQSMYGGAGGVNGAAGTQPGGGGAGSNTNNTVGGAGAAGQITVTCW
jgi:hypothetical protein